VSVGVACYNLACGTQCSLNCVKKVMFCCCLFLDIYVGVRWEPTLSDWFSKWSL